jgi:SAM-dependent methyltransferase
MKQLNNTKYKFTTSLPNDVSPAIKAGLHLAGNDFVGEQLNKWFFEEKEAYYCGNNGNSETDNWYAYMRLVNEALGFSRVTFIKDAKQSLLVLGPGSGIEIDKFASAHTDWTLFFLEASDSFKTELKKKYPSSQIVEPTTIGDIQLPSSSQDVVCAFSVLHHIPNVEHVIREAFRVLKPGGLFLVREPCSSMGDWRHPRDATPNERGMSSFWLTNTSKLIGFQIEEKPIPILFSPLNTILKKIRFDILFPTFGFYFLDRMVSKFLELNTHYWRDTWYKKMAPSAYFYVLRKSSHSDV